MLTFMGVCALAIVIDGWYTAVYGDDDNNNLKPGK